MYLKSNFLSSRVFHVEPQVRSIANHVRPDRQTLLFSATFRRRVERLARDILTDPIRVVQGDVGEVRKKHLITANQVTVFLVT